MSDATKVFSSKQESLLASELGWGVISGSGSRPGAPGDISCDDWLGECKTHEAPGNKIFFDALVWDKIQKESVVKHRSPALLVDDGSQTTKDTWVLCFAHSLNLSRCLVAPLNFSVRKNISFSSDKGHDYLDDVFKKNGGGIAFDYAIYGTNWCDKEVCILPFRVFKEIYNL